MSVSDGELYEHRKAEGRLAVRALNAFVDFEHITTVTKFIDLINRISYDGERGKLDQNAIRRWAIVMDAVCYVCSNVKCWLAYNEAMQSASKAIQEMSEDIIDKNKGQKADNLRSAKKNK